MTFRSAIHAELLQNDRYCSKLKELKRNPEIVVLKADTGNATVVTDSKDYDQKVNSMLTNECTYVKLPTRPIPINQISATVNQYVWNLYQNQKINQKCYYYLHCSNAVSPRFYGLPKIHKSAVPLRPIVSFVNSPAYNLSKFLSRILSGLVKNNYSVRNSREFAEYVKNCHVQKNEIFVSFGVVSLFTSVPVDKAFDLVLKLLSSDDALP